MQIKQLYRYVLFICLIIIFSSTGLPKKEKPIYLEKYLPNKYVKNGSVDYTDFIQAVLNKHSYVIFPNFPILVNDSGLNLKSNSKIVFQENSLVILKPTIKSSYSIFNLLRVENVELINLKIRGDSDKHIGSDGADGHGISIRASKNIKIRNPFIQKCWGDGILIGGLIKPRHNSEGRYHPSENILISGGNLINNRRNGLSIMSVKNILVENLECSNTKGAFPMAGIDIEPNYNKDYMQKVVLRNIVTKNNRYGIQLVLKKLVGVKDSYVDILIENHSDEKSQFGLRFDKMDRPGKVLEGEIKIKNSQYTNNKHEGVKFEKYQDHLCKVTLEKIQVRQKNQLIPFSQPKEHRNIFIKN